MSMTEAAMRDLIISLLNPRTKRDAQVEVGASNLSNPCHRCRAYEIAGYPRSDQRLENAWGGRVIGSAIHARLEHNARAAVATADPEGDDLAQVGFRFPGMEVERRVTIGELTPGRVIESTTDLWLPTEHTVADHKNTDLRKLAFFRDAIAMIRGVGALFGRDSQYVKVFQPKVTKKGDEVWRKAVAGVSEREYADGIAHARYKIERYVNQLHLYAMALVLDGEMVEKVFLNFIARDSAMTTDNRDSRRYLDDAAPHGVVSIGFTYNHEYATGYWKEAQAMAAALLAGTKEPLDYPAHPLCLVCASEAAREERMSVVSTEITDPVDPWVDHAAA